MPKQRAYGADARLLAARETSCGVLPLAGWGHSFSTACLSR
jgi:hypothetical protein